MVSDGLTGADSVIMKLMGLTFEVSFAIESAPYLAIIVIGVIVVVFYCLLKQLAEYSVTDHDTVSDQDARQSETEPILPREGVIFSYGATEGQPESSKCSAEDLCETECKICYDAARSCFFIPCGHGFTCFTCARRILEEENKICPICRRLIHRIRKLESP